MAFREIGMKPHLNPPVLVHTDEILTNSEVADTLIEFIESLECTKEKVEILGEGDV
jgi:hypothetical protein